MRSWTAMVVDVVVVMIMMVLMLSITDGARRRDAVEVAAEWGSRMVKRGLDDVDASLRRMPEGSGFQLQDSMMTAQGNERRKYQETFRGRKVFNTLVDTETEGSDDDSGHLKFIDGSLFDDPQGDMESLVDCLLSNDEAKRITLKHMDLSPSDVYLEKFDDLVYVDETTGKPMYVTEVQLSLMVMSGKGQSQLVRPYAFVDHCTREVVMAYDRAGSFAVQTCSSGEFTCTNGDCVSLAARCDGKDDCWDLSDEQNCACNAQEFACTNGDCVDWKARCDGNLDCRDRSDEQYCAAVEENEDKPAPPPIPRGPPVESCDILEVGGNKERLVLYYQGYHCLPPMIRTEDKKWCYLENEYVKTVDLNHTTDVWKTEIVSFECDKGFDDEVNGGHSPTLDGFYFGSKTFEMYRDWYNYWPLANEKPFMKVHYGTNHQNAYWDGNSMLFGDGSGKDNVYPYTVLDIVGHELGHAIVEFTSNLKYYNQSGGINEAFADMAGETAEAFVFGKPDWKTGADLYRTGRAIRYFEDPTIDTKSIKDARDYTSSMKVHYTSGVYNHAFWYLSEKMGFGIKAAFECFLNANRFHWKSSTNFEEGACGVIRGAYDAGYDMGRVAESFNHVGIKLENCPNLSEMVTTVLKPGKTRTRVSNVRNPMFKVTVPAGQSELILYMRTTPIVRIYTDWSYERAAKDTVYWPEGVGRHVLREGETLYIRLDTDDPEEMSVTVKTAY